MRIKPFIAAALTVLVASALLAGCGGDDGGEATGANDTDLTAQEEFVKEANKICDKIRKKLQVEVEAIVQNDNKYQPTPQEVGNNLVAPAFEEEAKELRAMQPPTGDGKQVDEIADSVQKVATTIRNDLSSYLNGPGGRLYADSEKAADAYGLTACGRL